MLVGERKRSFMICPMLDHVTDPCLRLHCTWRTAGSQGMLRRGDSNDGSGQSAQAFDFEFEGVAGLEPAAGVFRADL